jgi:hypothetical protein
MIKCTVSKLGGATGRTTEVIYAMEGGVTVGHAGELMLVSSGMRRADRNPVEFEIFPAGAWLHVKGEPVDE